jgi:protein-tyrosine-phosphatase
MRIIFICTGNTCRSPMCEGYFKKLCREGGRDDIMVDSAGTATWDGGGASHNSVNVMKEQGVDISEFSSKRLTPELIETADLLICMTHSHRAYVGQINPTALGKTYLLLDFDYSDSGGDITDPFGGSRELYSLCFDDMKQALDNLLLDIDKITGQ